MRQFGRILMAAMLAATITAPAIAQPAMPVVAPGNTLLTVSAEGRVLRKPDLAVFTAGVNTQEQTAAAALTNNARIMERVIAALRRSGIAEPDIQTSNISVQPVYSDPDREAMAAEARGEPFAPPSAADVPRIVGYRASNMVVVRQRNLRDFGRVIDALAGAGANEIAGPVFQLQDDRAPLDEARINAVTKAKDRADLYARATGLRVVRIAAIYEAQEFGAVQSAAFEAGIAMDTMSVSTPVQPGELEVKATVAVLYELAPR